MATTMAQVKPRFYWSSVALAVIAVQALPVFAVETRVSSQLRTSGYAYQIEEFGVAGTDDGLALLISPSVNLALTSKVLRTRFSWQHESLFYKDSQRSGRSFNEFDFSNVFSLYNDRLSWGVNAQSTYRVRNTQRGIFNDKITSSGELSKATSYGTYLLLKTASYSDINAALRLDYNHSQYDQPGVDDGLPAFENDSYRANVLFASRDRSQTTFWRLEGAYGKTQREQLRDYDSKAARALFGLPLSSRLSVIGRGSYEYTDNNNFYQNEFSSYGGGIELKLGRVSWVNASINRSTTTRLDEKEENTYWATEFYLAPSRRTSLEGYYDRRYFGRTANISGQYNVRALNIRLSVTDTVQTQTSLDQELIDLGIFVCPDNAVEFTDCYRPPSANYTPQPGESYQQVFDVGVELDQELVLRRSASLALGYSKRRLSLNVVLNSTDTEYVERGDEQRSQSVSVRAGWRLSERSRVSSTIRFYQIDYQFANREDDNILMSVAYDTTLSEQSAVSLSLRRTERNSNIDSFNASENRLWLTYVYTF
ncbi:TIGR03016 family PEP-CTERM system-associated outer membrane protein [Arsukibacterium ikkense]|uniref:TIGR03016 family PEP-CTERM system-associated outer membrane protein n=1 Tax=Arsukibacterium ikkense TaxID=336831 RepID=UPI001379131F|nr:TIGR03016 family PEP-CTERM system-associated outer membrane protein [Arsukibacterium ikkense]